MAANAKDFELSHLDASVANSTRSKKSLADHFKVSWQKPPGKVTSKRVIEQLRAGSKSGTFSSKNLQVHLISRSKTNLAAITID